MRDAAIRRRATAAAAMLMAILAGGCLRAPQSAPIVAPVSAQFARVADRASSPCIVKWDAVGYALPAAMFPPIEFTTARCKGGANALSVVTPVATPGWARPRRPTQTLFVAAAFAEDYAMRGAARLESIAHAAHVPMTWMFDDPRYLQFDARTFEGYHRSNGDGIEISNNLTVYYYARSLRWFAPAIAVDGARRERAIATDAARGFTGFWGITWNSLGTDATSDRGAPWGAYCAARASYKTPARRRDCSLPVFEWTARDLTRTYLTDTSLHGYSSEAAFSDDPDDLLDRGGFTPGGAAAYERALADAYAAAGETQTMVMMSQQEPVAMERSNFRDAAPLSALYRRVTADGMRAVTLREAADRVRAAGNVPRAIAFPFIPGGAVVAYDGSKIMPATIDYHDDRIGATFVAGHTLPSRVFFYAENATSAVDRALREHDDGDGTLPSLVSASIDKGAIVLTFDAPAATPYVAAFWSDPRTLGVHGAKITPAGRAGFVARFTLPRGRSTQRIACACDGGALAFSL